MISAATVLSLLIPSCDISKPAKTPKPMSQTEIQKLTDFSTARYAALIAAKENINIEFVTKVLVRHHRDFTAAMSDPKTDLFALLQGATSAEAIEKTCRELNASRQMVGQIPFDDQILRSHEGNH